MWPGLKYLLDRFVGETTLDPTAVDCRGNKKVGIGNQVFYYVRSKTGIVDANRVGIASRRRAVIELVCGQIGQNAAIFI